MERRGDLELSHSLAKHSPADHVIWRLWELTQFSVDSVAL